MVFLLASCQKEHVGKCVMGNLEGPWDIASLGARVWKSNKLAACMRESVFVNEYWEWLVNEWDLATSLGVICVLSRPMNHKYACFIAQRRQLG